MKKFPIIALSAALLCPLFGDLPSDKTVKSVEQASKASEPTTESETETKEDQPLKTTLTFTDDTRISGQPLSIKGKLKQLLLNSKSLSTETTFKTNQLMEMSLNGNPQQVESDHYAVATIKPHLFKTHNDSLRGQLVSIDDDTVVLDTWYAGRLTLDRSLVKTLNIFEQAPTSYHGPSGPKGWVHPNHASDDPWIFGKNTMTSTSRYGAARKIKVPQLTKLSFNIAWKDTPYFKVLFLSNEGENDSPSERYELSVYSIRITLNRRLENMGDLKVFQERPKNLRSSKNAKIDIYIDRSEEGVNAVYLDGNKIGTWTNFDDTKMKGEWLHFIPGQSSSPIRISQISVSDWSGNLPLNETEDEKEDSEDKENKASDAEPQTDDKSIRLGNGDIIIGKIKQIVDTTVTLSSKYGELKVPVQRLRSIELSTPEDAEKEDRMEAGDVRAWFHEGGYVTIKMHSFDGKKIKGYSQVYGDAEFDASAFEKIEFNIWNEKINTIREGTETKADW